MSTQLQHTKQWNELANHYKKELADTHLKTLFQNDPKRGTTLALEADGLYFDFSKNILNNTTLDLLNDLAKAGDLQQKISRMFAGDKINSTEDRAVLHVALRAPKTESYLVDGKDVVPDIYNVLEKTELLADKVRSGQWMGATGKPINAIVHVGIGGSEIGPHMVYEALSAYADNTIAMRFISNVDPANFEDATRGLDPERTLCIIVSKSFTTIETLKNAENLKTWILNGAADSPEIISKHFVAVASNIEAATEFGIDPENIFEMWDWVGGRYSVMSAVGLSVMIAIGPENFRALREGAHSIDSHFKDTKLSQNIPVVMALVSMLYNNFFGAETELITPYSSRLDRFTTYMQQANMESNGKSVTLDGEDVASKTGPVVWGKPGTDSQHTFMQHVHQSKRLIPTDIIIFKRAERDVNNQHMLLVANALAQAEALAFGKDDETLRAEGVPEELIPHKRMPGNIPNNILLFDSLTPYTLGQLIAIYEHKIFVQGALWNINSFDQWGVQLGKVLAEGICEELTSESTRIHDSSTSKLISKVQAHD